MKSRYRFILGIIIVGETMRASCFLLFMLCCVNLLAQTSVDKKESSEEPMFTWGPRAGLNIATAKLGDYGGETSARVGFHIGINMDLNFSTHFGFSPGLYFSQKGYKYTYQGYKTTAKSSYIHVPVMMAFRIGDYNKFQFHLKVGQYFAIGIGGKIRTYYDVPLEKRFFGTYSDLDGGLLFDMGALIARHYVIDVCYEHGWKSRLYNSTIDISLGYNF